MAPVPVYCTEASAGNGVDKVRNREPLTHPEGEGLGFRV